MLCLLGLWLKIARTTAAQNFDSKLFMFALFTCSDAGNNDQNKKRKFSKESITLQKYVFIKITDKLK